MPIYEYKCIDCGTHVEKMQKISEALLSICENCGGKLEKQLSLSGFQFKGAGWYVTDYANKSKDKGSEKTEKSSAGESTVKTDAASNKGNETAANSTKETAAKKE